MKTTGYEGLPRVVRVHRSTGAALLAASQDPGTTHAVLDTFGGRLPSLHERMVVQGGKLDAAMRRFGK